MSILAGVVTRHKGVQLTDALCGSIKRTISRFPDDKVIEFRDSRALLAKIDIGAYNSPGFLVGKTGSVSMLAGEPLLNINNEENIRTRWSDLQILQRNWDEEKWDIGAATCGVFCAVHYEPAKGRISLITDRLGIRPLYYWIGEQYIVFATALRILEEIPIIPKCMDLRAVTEVASFGFPLNNRTPYWNVFVLKAAEIVQIDEKGVYNRQYWRWDQLQQLNLSESDLLTEAYTRFVKAVERRLRTDKTTVAFLSGGLDSRCVVSILRDKNVTVHTFNFALPRTQDHVFAADFAKKVKTIHTVVPINPGSCDVPGYAKTLFYAWSTSKHRSAYPPERPRLVWSGEGGSVAIGHVYLNRKMCKLFRSGKDDLAIDMYLNKQYIGVPLKLFSPNIVHRIAMIPKQGIVEELNDIHCEDRCRSFHLFLMLNDQRRHLSNHFEGIDLHRTEFHLPFFDGHLLELILASPIDLFLEHRFYHKWLYCFPSAVTAVPWQTYPGHAKCPLPIPNNLAYQWGKESTHTQRRRNRSLVHETVSWLRADDFPHKIIRKERLGLATLLTWMGLRDYGYVMKKAGIFYKYWKRCNGNYIL